MADNQKKDLVVAPPKVEQLVKQLTERLATLDDPADRDWMRDAANRALIEELRLRLDVTQIRRIVTFKAPATPESVEQGLRELLRRTPPPQPMSSKAESRLRGLAMVLATETLRPKGPLSLEACARIHAPRLPKYVLKAVWHNALLIEWNTPNGDPDDSWDLFTWTDAQTTPSYEMRRRHMWDLIVGWARVHGRISPPDRNTLPVGGVMVTPAKGGAAPTVSYRTWTYDSKNPTLVDKLPQPISSKLDMTSISGAEFGWAKELTLGVYYIFLVPGDAPETAPNVDRIQIYVGKATPNIRFRTFDMTGHYGAVTELAEAASSGGALPKASLLVDLALLWVAMNNKNSWLGRAVVIAAETPAGDFDLKKLETAHISRLKAFDMHFGLNGTN